MTRRLHNRVTTEYAALVRGSTPQNCRYVRIDGEIIGAVIKGYEGWNAHAVGDLLSLRNPVARDLPTMDDAIAVLVSA